MKRIKSAIYMQIGTVLVAVLILSACAVEKRAPQNLAQPYNDVYIAAGKVAKLEITAPAEVGFMVRDACAGAACDLLAQVENPAASVPAQCPFPADKTTTEPAADRQADPEPTIDGSDDVEDVKTVDTPVGAYLNTEGQKGKLPGRLPE